MHEIKNDQLSQQAGNHSGQPATQHHSEARENKMTIQVPEMEEWDAVIPDQRRPQFRSSENYKRRNFFI